MGNGDRLKDLITIEDIQKVIKHPNACKDEIGRLRVGAAVGIARDSVDRAEALAPRQVGTMPPDPLLALVGAKVRQIRGERGWSRRELAGRTGLSERFLAQVESGEANPSVLSLSQIAAALDTSASALLAPAPRSTLLALLGLRGAGKSSVGTALAQRLGIPFIELDARVEEAAGLSLREIFEIHGEEYYRRLERESLESVIGTGERSVLATGGGIVTHRESFDLLRRAATTVWLRAAPDEHWNRVVQQGDHRPMANDPLAMRHLRELLAQRETLYRTADHIIDTSGAAIAEIVDRIAGLLSSG